MTFFLVFIMNMHSWHESALARQVRCSRAHLRKMMRSAGPLIAGKWEWQSHGKSRLETLQPQTQTYYLSPCVGGNTIFTQLKLIRESCGASARGCGVDSSEQETRSQCWEDFVTQSLSTELMVGRAAKFRL